MLLDHPHIRRIHFRERPNGPSGITQKLIVETSLPVPEDGRIEPGSLLEELHNNLQKLVLSGFFEFSEIEILPYREEESAFAA